MQTDFPYSSRRVCVYGPVIRPIELTATIHNFHRKTHNKSHVRAHNVLQTSYITCSDDFAFGLSFSPCVCVCVCESVSFCLKNYDLSYDVVSPKIWFFMTKDGQQIKRLYDLNLMALNLCGKCDFIFSVWMFADMLARYRSNSHQLDSISDLATELWRIWFFF